MYSGTIKSIGPRYCPSIEDKIVRFADKERHQLFFRISLEKGTRNEPIQYPGFHIFGNASPSKLLKYIFRLILKY